MGWRRRAEDTAGGHRRSRCRRSTRRTSTARATFGPAPAAGNDRRRRTSRRCGPPSRPGASRRSTSSTRARTARSATRSGSSRRAEQGRLPLLIVQGVLMTDLATRRRLRAAGCILRSRRRRRTRMTRAGCRRAARAIAAARRRPRGLADPGQRRPAPSACVLGFASRRGRPGRDRRACCRRTRRTPALAELAFGRPVAARTWLQASNPSERWKWDSCSRTCRP